MHQMTQKEIKPLREDLLKKNNGICPLCETDIREGESCLDHCHKSGQIRNTLCKRCNSLEGQMKAKWIRSGVAKKVQFEVFLMNLSLYLNPDNYLPIIHPSHAARPRKLMKSSYNTLKREIERYNKFLARPIKIPLYPKSKRLTKRIKELFNQFGLDPRYYSK